MYDALSGMNNKCYKVEKPSKIYAYSHKIRPNNQPRYPFVLWKKKLIISLLHYRILGRVFIQGKCILHWKIKKPYFFLADKRVLEKQRAREKTMNKIIAHVEMQWSTTKTRTERKNIYANTMFNTSSTTMEVLNGIYKIRAMPLFLYISTELFIIGYWCHDPD